MQGFVIIHSKGISQPEKVATCGKEGHDWDKTISPVTILKNEAQESRHKKATQLPWPSWELMGGLGEKGCIECL